MAGKKGTGGAPSHKDPACRCTACARKRQAQAVAVAAGAGGDALVSAAVAHEGKVNADLIQAPHVRRTARSRVEEWLAIRIAEPDITNADCAKRMGINRTSLQAHIAKGVTEGWLEFSEPNSRIEYEIIPKAITNLSELLDQKDRLATIETVKHTAFKQYLDSKGVSDAPTTVLALKIEATPLAEHEPVLALTGQIVGTPRAIED